MGWVVNAMPQPFYPQEKPCTPCIGGWVGPWAGLDGCRKSHPPNGIRSPDHLVCAESLDWLSYPGPRVMSYMMTNFELHTENTGAHQIKSISPSNLHSGILEAVENSKIIKSVYTYLLAPRSRVLLEKLTGSAASQEIPHIFGTRRFITILTSARHLSLSSANSI